MKSTVSRLAFSTSILLGAASSLGCAGSTQQSQESEQPGRFEAADKANLEAVRAALLDPAELPHLMWRQKLTISAEGKSYQLEAVVQSDGGQFQVLGLGPGGMKLFLVTHDETGAHSEAFVNRKMSLSPEYLLFDIQRALFWKPETVCNGVEQVWEFRGFSVLDRCQDGRLNLRKVSDGPLDSPEFKSQLQIEYSPGFDFENHPERVTLTHPQRGYQIDIVQLESHKLP